MILLLFRAAVVSLVTALVLTRLEADQQLVFWELVLLGVLVWQMRDLPSAGDVRDPPLFALSPTEPARLPRSVVNQELSALDAVSGHLAPERRLQPALRRLADHRLMRHGARIDSERGRELLGEDTWAWLTSAAPDAPGPEDLDSMVSRIEAL